MEWVLVVIVVALVFEYINGFHDTANSIATVVATKVLTPRGAICLAVVTNLLGALVGTAVAKTVSSGLVQTQVGGLQTVLICGLLGGIVWNLITWWFGLPSSSSHALIGGLCGAAIGSAGSWDVLIWQQATSGPWWSGAGLIPKVILPMFLSPLLGFLCGWLVMSLLYMILNGWKPRTVNRVFSPLQLFSAGCMGFSHGTNDAQKIMGIIFLALVGGSGAGVMDDLPKWAGWLYQPAESSAVGRAYVRQAEVAMLSNDSDKVKQKLDAAVKAKSAEAHWYKYQGYSEGKFGFSKDQQKALTHLREAAEGNVEPAVEAYTQALSEGRFGLVTNPQEAESFNKSHSSTRKLDPMALSVPKVVKSSKLFSDMPKQPEQQVAWLEQLLAKQDNATARVLLGIAYADGKGVAQNIAKASEEFNLAAARRDLDATYNLGVLSLRAQQPKQAAEYFEQTQHNEAIPLWIKVVCAITMAAGTAAGGWKIIKTLGHKMVKLHPVHGCAAETTGASVLGLAGMLGMPVSTTHAITTSIMGVGYAKSKRALNFTVIQRIIWAWVLTLPASGTVAWVLIKCLNALGYYN